MSQLDDLPLDPARDGAGPATTFETPRPSWAPLALIAVAIAVLGALGWYVWQRSRPTPQTATASAAPAAEAPAAAAPAVVLPPLEQMDPFLRTLLSGLSAHPQLLAWLATDDLLGSLATAIDRLAQGQSPARDLAPLRPAAGFAVATRRGATVVDARSFARYDGLAAAVASVDPARLAEAFRTIEPRLSEAWARQGHSGSVRDAVQRAAAVVASTPDAPDEIAVVQRVSGYGYANPGLESLPPAQKHVLRMGPANAARVRQAASAFAAALAAGR
ncbi:MAG: DUF3014 domain-containing protein [Vicinamibacterales bacterium]